MSLNNRMMMGNRRATQLTTEKGSFQSNFAETAAVACNQLDFKSSHLSHGIYICVYIYMCVNDVLCLWIIYVWVVPRRLSLGRSCQAIPCSCTTSSATSSQEAAAEARSQPHPRHRHISWEFHSWRAALSSAKGRTISREVVPQCVIPFQVEKVDFNPL